MFPNALQRAAVLTASRMSTRVAATPAAALAVAAAARPTAVGAPLRSSPAPQRSSSLAGFAAATVRAFSAAGASTRAPPANSSSSSSSAESSAAELPRVVHTISELRALVNTARRAGQTVGFVPTMGALHAGHVSLAARSLSETDLTIVSVFVNPTQFLPGEDLEAYPRTLPADLVALAQLRGRGGSAASAPLPLVVFAPSASEMYPGWPAHTGGIRVDLAGADATAEGARRPGHFRGVATVVAKLLNIASPDRAYFGQKDGMQCIVIRALVRQLNYPVQLRICATTRAKDGLALSSRNVYLTPSERSKAPVLFQALCAANAAFRGPQHERRVGALRQIARDILQAEPAGQLEYVSLASAETGVEMDDSAVLQDGPGAEQCMLSVAYKLGKPRLIDNLILGDDIKGGD